MQCPTDPPLAARPVQTPAETLPQLPQLPSLPLQMCRWFWQQGDAELLCWHRVPLGLPLTAVKLLSGRLSVGGQPHLLIWPVAASGGGVVMCPGRQAA